MNQKARGQSYNGKEKFSFYERKEKGEMSDKTLTARGQLPSNMDQIAITKSLKGLLLKKKSTNVKI